jgi:threonylcarbamoyladenosine tRNA methylthiotransferase MtaB
LDRPADLERSVKRVAIATMGCKVNAYDSAHIRGRMKEDVEIVPFDQSADVYVINTCTVTNRSDSEARNLIRRSKRRNPEAVTVVTGCYAQTNAGELAKVEGVDYIFGNGEKSLVGDLLVSGDLARHAEPQVRVGDVQALTEVRHVEAAMFEGQTRAYLKVQEGCMYRCTYCIIPFSRGGSSRSVPLGEAVSQARALAEQGYRELVLTGVHIGSWGHEYDLELADLVAGLAEVDGIERIRISSIDSPELRPKLVDLIAGHAKVAKHVHVPLQAGSDTVLERMARVYDTAQYQEALENLIARNSDICVGTDVIVGFPGETDEEFRETEALLKRAPVHYFHVFSFSPREGTPAAAMEGAIHGDVLRERSRILRALSGENKAAWAQQFSGRRLPVLFERPGVDGLSKGKASNYLDVTLAGQTAEPGSVRMVAVESIDSHGKAVGRLLD